MDGNQKKADYSDATPDIERTYNRMGDLASVSDAACFARWIGIPEMPL